MYIFLENIWYLRFKAWIMYFLMMSLLFAAAFITCGAESYNL